MHTIKQIWHLLAISLIAIAPGASGAQASAETRNVTLIELPSPPHGKQAMVYRRASGDDRDVIALAPSATVEDLDAALQVFKVLRERHGDALTRDIAASTARSTRPSNQGSRTKLHESFIQELRRSEPRQVGEFGSVKAIDIRVTMRTVTGTAQ